MKSSQLTNSVRQSAPLFAALSLLALGSARADLTTNMVAYYDFDQADATGLANKAPGATGGDATWTAPPNFGSTGFGGDAAFNPGDGVSDRSTLLVGNALNLADIDGGNTVRVTVPYGTGDLGSVFTISAWSYLAPGASNPSNRYQTFESKDTGVYDVSWGTAGNYSTTGKNDYLGYVETTNSGSAFSNVFAEEEWDHVVMVYDNSGANPTVDIYVNGATTPATVTDTSGTFAFSAINFGGSRDGASGDRDWDGMIDEVALWDRALTSGEVAELYALGLGGNPVIGGGAGSVVNLSSSDPTAGSVSGGGFYSESTVVPIAATPNPGYVFVSWDGDFTGQPASFNYTTTLSNVTSTATFAEDTADSDGDNLTNYEEIVIYGTLPNNPDTDGDLIPDGDEVDFTGTSPTEDDSALVSFVAANLCPNTAGAIAMSHPAIARDGTTGDVQLTLGFVGSADQTTWSSILLSDPSASIAPAASGEGWDVTLPAPSSSVDSYILLGRKP